MPPYVVDAASTLVLRALVDHHKLLLQHLTPTLIEVLSGFAIGNLAAFLMAALVIQYEQASRDNFIAVSIVLRSVPTRH